MAKNKASRFEDEVEPLVKKIKKNLKKIRKVAKKAQKNKVLTADEAVQAKDLLGDTEATILALKSLLTRLGIITQ